LNIKSRKDQKKSDLFLDSMFVAVYLKSFYEAMNTEISFQPKNLALSKSNLLPWWKAC